MTRELHVSVSESARRPSPRVNWAETPAEWSVYEAQELARQDGRRVVDDDDLLRGVLATHEVAHAFPALLPANADHLYSGGRVLIESGLSYGSLTGIRRLPPSSSRAIALLRHHKIFGVPVVPAVARAYGGSQASENGTGPLVLSAIVEGSHGEQLVSAAGADPAGIRRRLRR